MTNRLARIVCLWLAVVPLLVGCQGGGTGGNSGGGAAQSTAIRDEHLKAEQILASMPLGAVGADVRLPGVQSAWYVESLRAWARYPTEAEVIGRFTNAFESPERTQSLDIPELCFLLGALQRGRYNDLPVDTYMEVLKLRLFSHDVTFFPDPSREDPPGVPVNELLTAAQTALGPVARGVVRDRLTRTLGNNPSKFTPRETRWAARLIEGETGKIQTNPEELYLRLCLAAITHDQKAVLPSFEAAAKDHTNVAPFRFMSAMTAYLLADNPIEAGTTFAERVFQDRYLPEVYSWEAYRVLASQQDPALYETIQTAFTKLPESQHIDYGEFLARYGRAEDLPRILGFIDAPVDAVEERLTVARSPRLLDPLLQDVLAATQSPERVAMRQSIAESFSGKKDAPMLPPGITTDPREAPKLATELGVPVSQLHSSPLSTGEIRARRLWWLRFFPPEQVRSRLSQALAKGSEPEQLTALRMLGLYGGSQALPVIARAFGSKSQAVKTEAAFWYLAGWHWYAQEQQLPETDQN